MAHRDQYPRNCSRSRSPHRDRYDRDRDRDRDRDFRDRDHPTFTADSRSSLADHEFAFSGPRTESGRSFTAATDAYRPRDRHRSRSPKRSRGGESYRPGGGDHYGGGRGGSYRNSRGGSSRRGGNHHGGARPKWVPPPAHNRELMRFDFREKTPELMPGMVTSGFVVDLDGATEEAEAEKKEEGEKADTGDAEDAAKEEEENGDAAMKMSDDDAPAAPAAAPAAPPAPAPPASAPAPASITTDNATSTGETATSTQAPATAPSAPEKKRIDASIPGTAPASETEKPKFDVIAMIRQAKAKAAADKSAPIDKVAANDDFISFDFMEPEKPEQSESDPEERYRRDGKNRRLNDGRKGAPGAASEDNKPFSHRENVHGAYVPKDDGPPGAGDYQAAGELGPPPGLDAKKEKKKEREARRIKRRNNDYWTDEESEDSASDVDLGDIPRKRKRKYEDISRDTRGADGNVTEEWRIRSASTDPTPWIRDSGIDHSRSSDMLNWLHKEIIDFITYIQPRPYEHAVRLDLIHRVRGVIRKMWPDCDVRVFGSFAADLYLPNSDMDLVIVSESFGRHSLPRYTGQKTLWAAATSLRQAGFVQYGSIKVIAKARVPIIKYVDAETGLNVDISFENDSGLIANKTFQDWRLKYPAMPIIVTIIKHFIAMRGLNEVYIGGLGSFSITCMVVSLLQLLPSVQSGKLDPSLHLGVILLEFLDLYGKRFDTRQVGIRVSDPPGYYRKNDVFPANNNQPKSQQQAYLLSIQDPNNASNDVSRASYQIQTILSCFSEAFDALEKQMRRLSSLQGSASTPAFEARKDRSILGVILGGDYSHMEKVRERLKRVYMDNVGTWADIDEMEKIRKGIVPPPPPPPPLSQEEPWVPPPPPPPPLPNEPLPPPTTVKGRYGADSKERGGRSNAGGGGRGGNGRGQQNGWGGRGGGGNRPARGRGAKPGTRLNPLSLE